MTTEGAVAHEVLAAGDRFEVFPRRQNGATSEFVLPAIFTTFDVALERVVGPGGQALDARCDRASQSLLLPETFDGGAAPGGTWWLEFVEDVQFRLVHEDD